MQILHGVKGNALASSSQRQPDNPNIRPMYRKRCLVCDMVDREHHTLILKCMPQTTTKGIYQ